MKTSHKVFYLLFICCFIPSVGIYLANNLILGKEISLIMAFIIGLIPSFVISSLTSLKLKPRFAYLESDETESPLFDDKLEEFFMTGNEPLNIIEIKKEIEKKWVIMHFDENNCLIKFRSKISLLSWGEGAILKIDDENKLVNIVTYPIAAFTQKEKGKSKKAINSIREMIDKVA